MPPELERRLAAILSADVVGYSRLMAADEQSAVRTITAYRKEITNLVDDHRGRVVDATGDNAMAEFPTALDAVECAVEIQQVLKARNGRLPEDRRMEFRIGVHMGDVTAEGDRIYGDGVNIAARLQGLAQPGGICISGAVHEQVDSKLDLRSDDLGEQAVKNIPKPVRVFRVLDSAPASEIQAAPAVTDRPSIAVLPFVNMSADPDQEYFCDGLAEELIDALARLEGLRVVARTSAFQFKGKALDLREVGQKLNVGAVLEGSVRKAGNRLRINAQLINAEDGYHLWSERYDREMDDVFAVQDDIARSVVERLKVKLLGSTDSPLVKPSTDNLEAYDLYLHGRFWWERMAKGSPQKGIQYFVQAIAKDPAYAAAYAGIADSYNVLGWFGAVAPKEAYPKAEAAARRALELDDNLAEAHASLGYFATLYAWDWALAERELRRAVEANRNYSRAHLFYSFYFLSQGDPAAAGAAAKRALQLDPLSSMCKGVLGETAWFARQYDDAMEQVQKALETDQDHPVLIWELGLVLVLKGMYDEGIAELTRATALDPSSTQIVAFLGWAYALAGNRAQALKILGELKSRSKRQYVAPDNVARIYVGLGETDEAFNWLDRGYEDHSGWMAYLTVDPTFDPLRADPRFQDLLLRMNFPATPPSS